MTKVKAIEKVLEDKGGVASLKDIYENIEKYYPKAKKSMEWQSGLRGVLYRAINEEKKFKKIGISIYALNNYDVEICPSIENKIRMHSYIEGLCIEIGNFKNFQTYTPDLNVLYRDTIMLKDVATIHTVPSFSYPEIINESKRIDVIWFDKNKLCFPQKVFEVVDTVSTLNNAFNRSLQLKDFRTKFYIVAPEKHHKKFIATLNLAPYNKDKNRFSFINYNDIVKLYESIALTNKLESRLF